MKQLLDALARRDVHVKASGIVRLANAAIVKLIVREAFAVRLAHHARARSLA